MPLHPAWVKNISKRVLWGALEKDISKKSRRQMQEYFDNLCAYCGNQLMERWHADHLLPIDQGGFNHISNRVPACPRCNEKEKQGKNWEIFLKSKCSTKDEYDLRFTKIKEWIQRNKPATQPVSDSQREIYKKEINNLADMIDKAWSKLREISSI